MSVSGELENRFIAELLIFQAERQLREAIEDFGSAFVDSDRCQIEALIQDLQTALAQNDDQAMMATQKQLSNLLGNFTQRTVRRQREEESYWEADYWEDHF